ncbi:hypothetical protein O3G_MSEX014691 [Manduca sexta]|uniref:Tetratricopeptide repeat protein 8 n=1 Tax=Manduca sexta TaxID=7130 RepID=A0A921ZXP5_MANSE|nr:hypothetical protein O3G_MSEX014691 [Manduca sexta]
MDIEYRILNLYSNKQYDECLKLCIFALQDKDDRTIEFVQMRVMTIQAKIAGNGYEEVEYYQQNDDFNSVGIAKTPRVGTSFQREIKNNQHFGTAKKRAAVTATTRQRTGINVAVSRSARTALHTASRMSRAATSIVGDTSFTVATPLSLRLLSKEDNLFVPAAKTFFEYVFYCEGDVRKAMDVAFQALKTGDATDWWWNFSLARCYNALGMYRSTEESLRQALKQNKHISIYLRLVAMYVGLNQPLSALEICKQGLSVFHGYTPLLLEQARVHDEMGNTALAVKEYRLVAIEDPSNVEAIANIAMYNFYNDQPEIALRYYRRLLATNSSGPEIYNNLGLCCLYCNQWDLIIPCFRQALYFSTNPATRANIWFNIAHVALVRYCLSFDNAHACIHSITPFFLLDVGRYIYISSALLILIM